MEQHFASLREAGSGDESVAELLDGVHARLLSTDSFTPELVGAMRYARQAADGLSSPTPSTSPLPYGFSPTLTWNALGWRH